MTPAGKGPFAEAFKRFKVNSDYQNIRRYIRIEPFITDAYLKILLGSVRPVFKQGIKHAVIEAVEDYSEI